MATALLVMDIQEFITARLTDPAPLLNNIQAAIAAARKAGMKIIYVMVEFREGFSEISDRNKTFSASKASAGQARPQGNTIRPEVAPQPGDIIVVKRRFSAFTGSDLEVVLRSNNIDHLVLSGVSTSGVVLSTTREAAVLTHTDWIKSLS